MIRERLAQPFLYCIETKQVIVLRLRSLPKTKQGSILFYVFTTGFNEGINVLIKFTNGRSKVGRVRDYKSRFRKSRASTNKMNFPTISESITLRENSAASQRTEEDQINTTDVRGSRGFRWQQAQDG